MSCPFLIEFRQFFHVYEQIIPKTRQQLPLFFMNLEITLLIAIWLLLNAQSHDRYIQKIFWINQLQLINHEILCCFLYYYVRIEKSASSNITCLNQSKACFCQFRYILKTSIILVFPETEILNVYRYSVNSGRKEGRIW